MFLYAMGVDELAGARKLLWTEPPPKAADSMFELDSSDDDNDDDDDSDDDHDEFFEKTYMHADASP
jgi:hypothetical protein